MRLKVARNINEYSNSKKVLNITLVDGDTDIENQLFIVNAVYEFKTLAKRIIQKLKLVNLNLINNEYQRS